jgi:hypothetical protein
MVARTSTGEGGAEYSAYRFDHSLVKKSATNRKACASSFETDTEGSFFEFTALPQRQVRLLLLFIRTFQRKGHPHHALSRSTSGTSWREAGLGANQRLQLCSARQKARANRSEKRDCFQLCRANGIGQ